ncbi:unnamed protein product [Miscanthus lutarioriparius]|uniref:Uncharacterized protein n=1 Tax=Miscanthus lutarioriparius TaxID=422564 RepID=A0A811SDD4_9POAL|nr:unnamed protein product [Miscanthus lutarioriparius]
MSTTVTVSPPPDPFGDDPAAPGTSSSNFTLLYIIIAVLAGVMLYMAFRHGQSVLAEWRRLQAGGHSEAESSGTRLGLSVDEIAALPTFTYRARTALASPHGGGRSGSKGRTPGRAVECVALLPWRLHRRLAARALVVPRVPRAPGARACADGRGGHVPAAAAAATVRCVTGAANGIEGPGAIAVEKQLFLLDKWIWGEHHRLEITIAKASHWVEDSVSDAAGVCQGGRYMLKVTASGDIRNRGCPVQVAVADEVQHKQAVVGEERWNIGKHRGDRVSITVTVTGGRRWRFPVEVAVAVAGATSSNG